MTKELSDWPSPEKRALELLRVSLNSKNMAVWFQEEIVKYLDKRYQIRSEYEKQVLIELKKIDLWDLKKH